MNPKYLFTVSFLFMVLASALFVSADSNAPALTSAGGAGNVTAVSATLVSAANATDSAQTAVSNRAAVLRAQYQRARINYLQARERYKAAIKNVVRVKAEYNNTRTKWIEAKNAYISAANGTNATELKKVAVGKGQAFLQKQLERMTSHLELVRSKVESMEVLGDEEKILILADIDVDLAVLEDIKARAENVTDADELRNLSREAKDAWLDARKGVARAIGKIEQAQEEKLFSDVRNFSQRIERAMFQLEKRGIDTAEAEALLNSYGNTLQLAKEELDAAKQEFAAGNTTEARAHVRASHRYVVEAHGELKRIVNEIRNIIRETNAIEQGIA